MKFSASLLLPVLYLQAASVCGLRLFVTEGRRRDVSKPMLSRRSNMRGTNSLNNGMDISYYTNLTLGGDLFSVLIDTGSSDLWVAGIVSNSTGTGVTSNITYAIGEVVGEIRTADLQFFDHSTRSQAFLQIPASDSNPAGEGLVGLGPSSGSTAFALLNESDAALPVLDRIFMENTSTPNVITFLLGRTIVPTDIVNGAITIGEVLDDYTEITQQHKYNVTIDPLVHSIDQHFQILLDTDPIYGPNNKSIFITTGVDETVTEKQPTATFDTGFTLSQVPRQVADDIYSGIEGAEYTNITGVGEIWIVPCTQEVSISFKAGGIMYPIHPLDATLDAAIAGLTGIVNSNGTDCCLAGFQASSTTANEPDYDMILGTTFLRNVYALFNYGDFVGDDTTTHAQPYIQFLSTTDITVAHSEFVAVRLEGVDNTTQISASSADDGPDSSDSDTDIAISPSPADSVEDDDDLSLSDDSTIQNDVSTSGDDNSSSDDNLPIILGVCLGTLGLAGVAIAGFYFFKRSQDQNGRYQVVGPSGLLMREHAAAPTYYGHYQQDSPYDPYAVDNTRR